MPFVPPPKGAMTFRRTNFFGTLFETFSGILVGFLYGSKLVLRYEIGLTGQVDPGIRGIICVLFLVPFRRVGLYQLRAILSQEMLLWCQL